MKLHYFDQDEPDEDDHMLIMAKKQGYVPKTCLLGGAIVLSETNAGRDACAGCNCPRGKCNGRPPVRDAR